MRYTRVSRLGRGGMGVVDLATDEDGTPVALKCVPLHGSSDEAAAARQRIRREAEVLRSLDHPSIVGLLDVVDAGDDVVLVMPYLPGGSLAERVRDHGPLPPAEVAALARPLLEGLAAAHRQGVVHRDIKPSNVLFDEDGAPLLTDFGAATSRDATQGLTGAGLVVGTPTFMAPEQARGERPGPAADVFALGATLRFALTGTGPWGGDGAVAFHRAVAGRVERLPRGAAPEDLARLLAAACDPDPRRRPSAASLVGGPAGTEVVAAGARSPLARFRRRHRARPRVWVAGAVLAAAGTAGALVLLGDPRDPAAGDGTATPTTVPPCVDLPYQPCGEPRAPGTDGRRCVDDRADYDDDPATGCEAVPDDRDGATLVAGEELAANLVPADDADVYELPVPDRAQLLCDGTLTVTLTAPAGVAQRLEVLEGGEVLDRVGSTDGTPASVDLREPSCFTDDSTTLEVRVSSIGADRTADRYLLEVDGSF